MKNAITGVSLVNEECIVIIFVEASMPEFSHYRIDDHVIILENETSRLSRRYGAATIEALSHSGQAIIQRLDTSGKDAGNYLVEVLRGL
jgi:hypothetical protein